ncbi:hypothetical protein TWF730_005261 [Orbilia blumenaviensis]|uniref:Uncharacterized protein n=1 Tax=Orbilia blumenaviensis TaxID=1796055 RepID=A0AAV9VHV1_9PEZI
MFQKLVRMKKKARNRRKRKRTVEFEEPDFSLALMEEEMILSEDVTPSLTYIEPSPPAQSSLGARTGPNSSSIPATPDKDSFAEPTANQESTLPNANTDSDSDSTMRNA